MKKPGASRAGDTPQKGSSLSGNELTSAGLRSCRSNRRSAQSRSSRPKGAGRWAEASSHSSSRVRELRDRKERMRDSVAMEGAAKTPKQAGWGQGAAPSEMRSAAQPTSQRLTCAALEATRTMRRAARSRSTERRWGWDYRELPRCFQLRATEPISRQR